ncbi:unnamed protein product [Lactuca saligna]|uniref:MULE transposase domain-containing protein n=1 Tax=Lactuca saligna TaxID=75948 RepID=A0AA35YI11_LACSI|nr:unnamed protein product [Lactuca saligna]
MSIEGEEGDPKDDEDENVPNVKGKPMFNEFMYWKKQLPILDNWKWFLENSHEDLHLEGGFGKTLMLDQHKGISEAEKDLFPEIEHRQCVRHVKKRMVEGECDMGNALKKWKGQASAFKKWKGQVQRGNGVKKGKGEGERGSCNTPI